MEETITPKARRYADAVISTPFHPATTKADARKVVIDAWRNGFETARSEEEKKQDGRIRLVNNHGTFTADAYLVEMAISKFLPASADNMRDLFRELGYQEKYSDVLWVSEWLVMLAAESPEIVENPTFKPAWKR